MSNEKVFTFDEISRHNQKDDLWVILHDSVYDVSEFMSKHPGGEDILLDLTELNHDGTSPFEDVGHSLEARGLLTTLKIGKATKTAKPQKELPKHMYKKRRAAQFFGPWHWAIIVCLLLLGIYYMF